MQQLPDCYDGRVADIVIDKFQAEINCSFVRQRRDDDLITGTFNSGLQELEMDR